MTLVTLRKPFLWPGVTGKITLQPALATAVILDGAGDHQSYVFAARESMTITHVGFKPGAAAGSPTVDVRIETVGATGLPSGTLWATDTNIVTAAIASNTYSQQALTASASIAAGQVFAIKVAYVSGTSLVLQHLGSMTWESEAFPYSVTNTTGADAKASALQTALGCFSAWSSSTAPYSLEGMVPASAHALNSFNNTNSAKRGLKFTAPFDGRLIGIRFYHAAQVGDFNVVLFDDAGTPAELGSTSTAYDGDLNALANAGSLFCPFDNAVTVAAGTTYRAMVEPSSATNVNLSTLTVPGADYRNATPWGTDGHYTTFASAAWDDTNTTVFPILDLVFDQIDDGAGTGGGGGGGQRVISG